MNDTRLLRRDQCRPAVGGCVMGNWTSDVLYHRSATDAAQAVPYDPLEKITDEELIFEMIKRGYAVAKMDAQDLAESMK